MNRVLALLVAATTLLALLPTPGSAQVERGAAVERAYWGPAGDPSEVSPGEFGRRLTIDLINEDEGPFYAVEAELQPHPALEPSYAGAESVSLAETFSIGELWSAQFRVDLDDNLTVGDSLEVVVDLTMRRANNGPSWSEGDYLTEQFEVDVPIPGRSILDVAPGADTLFTKSRATVPIDIRNAGDGPMGTLEITFEPGTSSALQVQSPLQPIRVKALPGGQRVTTEVQLITPETTGVHTLLVQVDHVNSVGEDRSITKTIPFLVAETPYDPISVTLERDKVTAGRQALLPFTISNMDGRDALQVDLDLEVLSAFEQVPSVVPVNASNRVRLGNLPAGETSQVDVRVLVAENAANTQTLRGTLSWTDPDGFDHEEVYEFGLIVLGAIDIRVSGLEASVNTRNGEVVVTGTVTNTGNADAFNAYLSIRDQAGIVATDPAYQGDLDPNSPIPFGLETTLEEGEEIPDTVLLELTWTDDLGRPRAIVLDAPVRTHDTAPRQGGGGNSDGNDAPAPALTLLLAALAAAALAVHRGDRRGRRRG